MLRSNFVYYLACPASLPSLITALRATLPPCHLLASPAARAHGRIRKAERLGAIRFAVLSIFAKFGLRTLCLASITLSESQLQQFSQEQVWCLWPPSAVAQSVCPSHCDRV